MPTKDGSELTTQGQDEDRSLEGNPNYLEVRLQKGETKARAVAKAMLLPEVGAAITANAFRPPGLDPVPLAGLIEELRIQCERVSQGSMIRGEDMLVSQAHTLDAIFNCLAQRAASNMGHHLNATAEYLRLALRAQAQSRVTWEAVGALKNPSRIYAKQANIAHGHQQVNNGAESSPRVQESEKAPNELLGQGDG